MLASYSPTPSAWRLLPHVLAGCLRRAWQAPQACRQQVIPDLANILRLFGAPHVRLLDVAALRLPCYPQAVAVPVSVHAAVLSALAQRVNARRIFEIGTLHGQTTYALAVNNPQAHVYTLDLPDTSEPFVGALEITDPHLFHPTIQRGEAFQGTRVADRITQLLGDSALFDYSLYYRTIDLAFIDGSHSYSYVESDTMWMLQCLSDTGTICWHDYPAYSGVYAYLNTLGKSLPIRALRGTGMAIYSRHPQLRAILEAGR